MVDDETGCMTDGSRAARRPNLGVFSWEQCHDLRLDLLCELDELSPWLSLEQGSRIRKARLSGSLRSFREDRLSRFPLSRFELSEKRLPNPWSFRRGTSQEAHQFTPGFGVYHVRKEELVPRAQDLGHPRDELRAAT